MITFHRGDDLDAVKQLDELAELYVQVHADPPYDSGRQYSREAFLTRTRQQLTSPGFTLVTARRDRALAGFSLGFAMGPGGWWADAGRPPADLGKSILFAVIELLVAQAERQQGLGKELLGRLLEGRGEDYATLAARPDAPAHAMYERWGWSAVATFEHPPYSDVMVAPLHGCDEVAVVRGRSHRRAKPR